MSKPFVVSFILTLIVCLLSPGLSGEKLATLPEIKQPKDLSVDQTQLYVTENATVYIYSLKDFKLATKFGSKGQGPQEFHTLPHVPISVDATTDKLVVGSIRKISYYTKQGEFLSEKRAQAMVLNIRLHGDGFLGWAVITDKGISYSTVNLYDSELNKLQEVFRLKDSFQGPGNGYQVLHNVFTYYSINDRIILPGENSAAVDIFDSKMKKVATIQLDQKQEEVDDEFKRNITKDFETNPETREIYPMLKPLIFDKYFPVISDFFVDGQDGGLIYIMTRKRENGANEFYIYDLCGKFKKRAMIPIRYETEMSPYPASVQNGILYQLVENEKTEVWEFHASPIKSIDRL